jgi:hypothetical protein
MSQRRVADSAGSAQTVSRARSGERSEQTLDAVEHSQKMNRAVPLPCLQSKTTDPGSGDRSSEELPLSSAGEVGGSACVSRWGSTQAIPGFS